MTKIKLSKALKEKNRLAKQLTNKQATLQSCNSILTSNIRDFDPKVLLTEIKEDTVKLVSLKVAIAKANGPINQLILRAGENKALITFLRKLNTNDGQVIDRYSHSAPLTYEAVIKSKTVIDEIATLEKQIEELQEQIDTFNHSTEVEY